MKRLFFFIIVFLIGLPIFSQSIFQDLREIVLYIGQTEVIGVDGPTRIAIGKPEIVDVSKVTEKEITLAAKGRGETTFIWWDKEGEHSRYIKVFVEDMSRIKERIDTLISEIGVLGIHTKALDSENKVLLLGQLKDESDKERLLSALGELQDKTVDLIDVRGEESSVEIDVQVLELDSDATKKLGFDLPSAIAFTESSGPTTAAVTGFSKVFHVSDWTRTAFTATLNFLVQEGKAKILSRPRLVCRSGKEAELLVGGEVPVFTTQVVSGGAGAQGTSVEYKEYGIKLNIKPTVVSEDKIDLGLNVEVSDIGEAVIIGEATAPTAKAYPISKRLISTELSLKDGSTLSIGGLIKKKSEEDLKKFPWLADLPVLGIFFRTKETRIGGGSGERGETELFITLTPHIIGVKEEEAKEISLLPKPVPPKDQTLAFYEGMKIPDELKGYVYNVQKKILSNISYPSVLLDTGWEAHLVVSLKLDSSGELKEAKVTESSGYKIFDTQTLDTVRNLSYPPFPPKVDLEEINIEVPVVYRTKR